MAGCLIETGDESVTVSGAAEYLRKYAQKQDLLPRYMRALGLGDRLPSPSEEKYLLCWQEMGFPPEAVAIACDKTILKCHELKWAYCNGILRRWHEAGLHTGDKPAARRSPAAAADTQDVAWMKKYIDQRDKGV